MTPRVYELYGLRVWSQVELAAPPAPSMLPPYDVAVRWGARTALADALHAGRVLARFVYGNGQGYTLTDTGSLYILRVHGLGEFCIDHDLRAVRVHLGPDVRPAFAGLLVAGTVLACILTLAGEHVLHASAVRMGGSALACVGDSGTGKSTLATLLCAQGAQLITDDLLRLQPEGTGWRCFPGTGEIRLRPGAAALATAFVATVLGTTADGRTTLPLALDRTMPPLRAMVLPRPSRCCQRLQLTRLSPAQALLALMASPRVQGLQQPAHLQQRLDACARLAAGVPVYQATIPWGPPFPHGLAAALVREVGLTGLQEESS
jgi:hypothetical protein